MESATSPTTDLKPTSTSDYYERFTDIITTRANSITTGRIYQAVIDKERKGDYLGKTVQIIPNITDEIKRNIVNLGETGILIL